MSLYLSLPVASTVSAEEDGEEEERTKISPVLTSSAPSSSEETVEAALRLLYLRSFTVKAHSVP